MKVTKNIVLGIILILIGIILGGNTLGIFNINIFFKGWWTLFIIIPCLVDLINGKDSKGNIIGLVIGIFLLLACRKIISFDVLLKLLIGDLIHINYIFNIDDERRTK